VVGDLEREKTRDTSAAADIREMTRDKMRENLIPVEVFRAILEEVGIAIRQVIDHSSLPARDKEQIHANIRKLGETDYAAKVAKQLDATEASEETD
jgi:phage terminase Nu1 subunit (DNA packaging protein)